MRFVVLFSGWSAVFYTSKEGSESFCLGEDSGFEAVAGFFERPGVREEVSEEGEKRKEVVFVDFFGGGSALVVEVDVVGVDDGEAEAAGLVIEEAKDRYFGVSEQTRAALRPEPSIL